MLLTCLLFFLKFIHCWAYTVDTYLPSFSWFIFLPWPLSWNRLCSYISNLKASSVARSMFQKRTSVKLHTWKSYFTRTTLRNILTSSLTWPLKGRTSFINGLASITSCIQVVEANQSLILTAIEYSKIAHLDTAIYNLQGIRKFTLVIWDAGKIINPFLWLVILLNSARIKWPIEQRKNTYTLVFFRSCFIFLHNYIQVCLYWLMVASMVYSSNVSQTTDVATCISLSWDWVLSRVMKGKRRRKWKIKILFTLLAPESSLLSLSSLFLF